MIGVKPSMWSARPASHWICAGCWLWRRPRITIQFLDGTLVDSKPPARFGWLITKSYANAFSFTCRSQLFTVLQKPPTEFCLLLRSPNFKLDTILHAAKVNRVPELKLNTELWFTLDNVPMKFSLYELGEAMKHGVEGHEAGTRMLAELFAGLIEKPSPEEQPKKVGKPKNLDDARVIKKDVRR